MGGSASAKAPSEALLQETCLRARDFGADFRPTPAAFRRILGNWGQPADCCLNGALSLSLSLSLSSSLPPFLSLPSLDEGYVYGCARNRSLRTPPPCSTAGVPRGKLGAARVPAGGGRVPASVRSSSRTRKTTGSVAHRWWLVLSSSPPEGRKARFRRSSPVRPGLLRAAMPQHIIFSG